MIRVSLSHHTTPHHNPALLARESGPLRVPDSHVAEAPKGAKSVQFFPITVSLWHEDTYNRFCTQNALRRGNLSVLLWRHLDSRIVRFSRTEHTISVRLRVPHSKMTRTVKPELFDLFSWCQFVVVSGQSWSQTVRAILLDGTGQATTPPTSHHTGPL